MRILLDENLPEGLIAALRGLGHIVDSVGSLGLKGLANGQLYRDVASGYDLFFTKDREFAARVETLTDPARVVVVLTTIPQLPEAQFVGTFLQAFTATDWSSSALGREWPTPVG